MYIVGDEKNKIILEETYDNLKNMCLQKKKTVKNLEKEIQVSITEYNDIIFYNKIDF